jgi:DNA-binding transcriptional LysR family regulator
MDLRHLRTFVTVAEQGTVSKAALRLRITQPALSRQIRDLEQELELKLFDRVGGRLLLTSEGEQLLADCQVLLGQVGSLGERAKLLRRGDIGLLKVATSPQQMEGVFSTFLHRYAERYPNVKVKFIEAVGLEILALVERGEVHLGISLMRSVQADNIRFASFPLPPVEFLAACHPSLALGHGGSIDISRLAPYPLLLLDSGFAGRKTFDAACRLAELEPNILFESRAPHTLLALAEAGHGVAIIPSAVRTHRYELQLVRITHQRKTLREPLAVVWDKRRALPRYAEGFFEPLAAHMRAIFPIAQPSARKADATVKRTAAQRTRAR